VVFFAGCDEGTVERIKEKAAVFKALTDEQKRNVAEGVFEIGDSADMVYMAIGAPLRVKSKVIPEGTIEMWTYVNYFSLPSASRLSLNTARNSEYKPRPGESGNPAQALAVPETAANTLYVFFLNGRVTQIKIDTQGRK
jgi:hypothetical protein